MSAKTIEATFTGEDGSLGYKNGSRYLLIISSTGYWREYIEITPLSIPEQSKCKDCIYSGITKFLDNWNNIQIK